MVIMQSILSLRCRPSPCQAHRRGAAAALRSRRGVTSLLVATMAGALVGMAALATEGGSWYVTQRAAATAASR